MRIGKGTNILLVKGTVYTGMKGISARIIVITSASSDAGRLMNKLTIQLFSVSKSRNENCRNRIATCPGRLEHECSQVLFNVHAL